MERECTSQFELSCLVTGFDDDGTSHLYQTNLVGSWKANAIGLNARTVKEFLERNCCKPEVFNSEEDTVKLAIRALLEVVQLEGNNLEVALLRPGHGMEFLTVEEIDQYISKIMVTEYL